MQSLWSPSQDVDRWSFDVFALNSASTDHALQTLVFELITRYGLNSRFKVFILGSYCTFHSLCYQRNAKNLWIKKRQSNVIISQLFTRNARCNRWYNQAHGVFFWLRPFTHKFTHSCFCFLFGSWISKHNLIDCAPLYADPDLMPDWVPVRTGERILQTQQPLPQPRPRRWRDPDAALPAAALWACGKSLCYFHLDQRQG